MLANELKFWLRGYFELEEDEKSLSHRQLKCIQDHLVLVKSQTRDATNQAFVQWLEGALEATDITVEANRDRFTVILKKRLDSELQKVTPNRKNANEPLPAINIDPATAKEAVEDIVKTLKRQRAASSLSHCDMHRPIC